MSLQRRKGNAAVESQIELLPPPTFVKVDKPHIWVRLAPAEPTEAYETYWRFAAERQAVFFKRVAGAPRPWTSDPILERYKFTNTYRASDRVSQYLIRNVIYSGTFESDDVLFRILLFKLFNKIDTWELLERTVGAVCLQNYRFDVFDGVLTRAMERGERIYSAAYIMPSGTLDGIADPKKHRFHLRLLEQMIRDRTAARMRDAKSMREGFELLRSYPSIGGFLAYQFITDINYSTLTDFSERDFVMPGPGALDGIRKCFSSLGGLSESEMIRYMADHQEREFDSFGLDFKMLWGRPLQLIDCQNVFCEVSKYSRVRHPELRGTSGRARIKQHFVPSSSRLSVWYPPKWRINDHVMRENEALTAGTTSQAPVSP